MKCAFVCRDYQAIETFICLIHFKTPVYLNSTFFVKQTTSVWYKAIAQCRRIFRSVKFSSRLLHKRRE